MYLNSKQMYMKDWHVLSLSVRSRSSRRASRSWRDDVPPSWVVWPQRKTSRRVLNFLLKHWLQCLHVCSLVLGVYRALHMFLNNLRKCLGCILKLNTWFCWLLWAGVCLKSCQRQSWPWWPTVAMWWTRPGSRHQESCQRDELPAPAA